MSQEAKNWLYFFYYCLFMLAVYIWMRIFQLTQFMTWIWDKFYDSLMIAIRIIGVLYEFVHTVPWINLTRIASQWSFWTLLVTAIVIGLWPKIPEPYEQVYGKKS